MSTPLRAGIIGSTGLVGSECIRALLDSGRYAKVFSASRRPLSEVPSLRSVLPHPSVEEVEWGDPSLMPEVDHFFCSLSTTRRRAGGRARFREIDFDLPLRWARWARDTGARHLSLVSAMGARAGAFLFYSRTKGELEDAVQALEFPGLTILRPSVIGGAREELRLVESVGQLLGTLAPRRYRTIPATVIASAMVAAALRDAPGTRVVESGDIWTLAL